jgi:hypothetical protein
MSEGVGEAIAETAEAADANGVDPIAAAPVLHARFHLTSPDRIRVELIAAALGAYVIYGEAGSADARVVRAGGVAYFCVAREHRDTPRARFSIATSWGTT